MRLNKRKCRKFVDPCLQFPANHELLHAPQISYIVRTAIRIIDHHKTLILYVYPRKQLAKGDFRPCYTVFQNKDDYITLSRKEDGSTTWRKSAFENLDSSYRFSDRCAFYSAKDESCISRYFNSTDSGFEPLIKAQDSILERRRRERQLAKEKAVIDRMVGIPALPHNLKSWIHKSGVTPAYFFYDYKRGGRNVPGVCSACSHEIILSGVKQGNKYTCPNCKHHDLIAKPRSRRGYNMHDRCTCEVIQNMGDGRIVIRIIKAYSYYYKNSDAPDIQVHESARQFIWLDTNGKVQTEHYYYDHNSGIITNWKNGIRPEYIMYQSQFLGSTCGHLYTRNLPEALSGTPWQYCTIADFYNHFQERMQALPFLQAHLAHPRLEHLYKVGFYNIVSDLVYRDDSKILDETQNRTHKILGIAAEDVNFLRELGADMSILKTFQGYAGIKGRQELLLWQLENDVKHNILPILKYITVHKLIRYTERQFQCQCKNKAGSSHYQKIQDVVTIYRDYLEMSDGLNYDMKNSFVLYPKDLQKSHDRVQKRIKIKESAQLLQDFKTAMQDVRERMAFEFGGMKISVPETLRALEFEGNALHHCVGGYADYIAKKECIILFIRRCSDETKPFYTIELRGQEIIQVRGLKNCAATPEVQKFINAFRQHVLQGSVDRNAA